MNPCNKCHYGKRCDKPCGVKAAEDRRVLISKRVLRKMIEARPTEKMFLTSHISIQPTKLV